MTARRPRTILQAGRLKAYLPVPAARRRAAVAAALLAWERGDWFEAHELLEPAWMGAPALGERLRTQALIKLAAAFVHQARGNAAGMRTNLAGAAARLADAADLGANVAALATAVDGLRSATADDRAALSAVHPPDLRALLADDRPTGRPRARPPAAPRRASGAS